jgi:hypothetical protein
MSDFFRLRYAAILTIIVAFIGTMALRAALAHAEDAGAARVAAEYAAAVDAGQPAPDGGPVAATDKPALPPPADPVAAPGQALDGVKLWLKTGWAYAVLFVVGSLLIAAGARFQRLRTGKYAVWMGTGIAAILAILGAKAGGMSDAQSVAAAMQVGMGGIMWALWPNRSTIDLSTATPEQIAAALAAANQPQGSKATAPA